MIAAITDSWSPFDWAIFLSGVVGCIVIGGYELWKRAGR